jgi:hypothetical protein
MKESPGKEKQSARPFVILAIVLIAAAALLWPLRKKLLKEEVRETATGTTAVPAAQAINDSKARARSMMEQITRTTSWNLVDSLQAGVHQQENLFGWKLSKVESDTLRIWVDRQKARLSIDNWKRLSQNSKTDFDSLVKQLPLPQVVAPPVVVARADTARKIDSTKVKVVTQPKSKAAIAKATTIPTTSVRRRRLAKPIPSAPELVSRCVPRNSREVVICP